MNPPERKPSIWTRDLFGFLGSNIGCGGYVFFWMLAAILWPPLALISLVLLLMPGSKRRAKLLLFSELSHSLSAGTPLPVALGLCIQSFRSPGPSRSFPENVLLYPLAARFLILNSIIIGKARLLKNLVEAGMPLSDAMGCCSGFKPQEIAIIRAGEEWSLLPQALQRLTKYQMADQRYVTLWAFMLYPIGLIFVAGSIITFILTYILPKFEDMFAQLGVSSLPPMTENLIKISYAGVHHLHLIMLALIILALILYRTGIEWLPFIRRWARADRDARWLAGLSLALDAGIEPAKAVRSAGGICGGRVEDRSEKAAAMIEGGHSLGTACVAQTVLSSETNHQMQLLDERDRYVEGLKAIAQDAETDAQQAYQRACIVVEIASHLSVAVVIGLLIAALYLPLFEMGRHII